MVREGRVAGVILFAENFPSREAGRRLIARLQAIPRPPGLRDPLLVMVDQEGGLVKRIDGAPTVSAEAMGARGPRVLPRPGRAHRGQPARRRGQRRPRPGPRRRPPGQRHRGDRTRLRLQRRRRSRRPRSPSPKRCRQGGVAATAKHFPGLGSATANTDFAVQRIGLPKATLRAVDEAPYRPFVEAGGEMVMLSSAIYPALSPKPAAFARPIATGELRGRLGFEGVSITDALGSPRSPTSAGRRRPGWRRPGPAPTCSSSPTTRRGHGPATALRARAAAGVTAPGRLRTSRRAASCGSATSSRG